MYEPFLCFGGVTVHLQDPSLDAVAIRSRMESCPSKFEFHRNDPQNRSNVPMGIEYHMAKRPWFHEQWQERLARAGFPREKQGIQGAFRQNPPVALNSHQRRECHRSNLHTWAAKEAAGFCSRNFFRRLPQNHQDVWFPYFPCGKPPSPSVASTKWLVDEPHDGLQAAWAPLCPGVSGCWIRVQRSALGVQQWQKTFESMIKSHHFPITKFKCWKKMIMLPQNPDISQACCWPPDTAFPFSKCQPRVSCGAVEAQ